MSHRIIIKGKRRKKARPIGSVTLSIRAGRVKGKKLKALKKRIKKK